MNFLAHIYLSFDQKEIVLGNFFADHIKGNRISHFPTGIHQGIMLHRAIDSYTDNHPAARASSKLLHATQGHYSRVIVDIFYDHFLAVHWDQYSDIPLERYTQDFYQHLEENFELLPEKTQHILPYIKAQDWLLNYREWDGLEEAFGGLDRRTKGRSNMLMATRDLRKNYSAFEGDFFALFADLITFSQKKLEELCGDSFTSEY